MDIRIIPCSACGGDGGHHDFAGHWDRCVICNGTGDEEVELQHAEQDMTEYAACKEAAEIAEKQVATLRRVMQAKDPLHPETRQLVHEFSKALADKLAKAEQKYGYRDNWRTDDWESDCRAELMRHIEKGDPLDVAAYCAFMWRRGWSTNSP